MLQTKLTEVFWSNWTELGY